MFMFYFRVNVTLKINSKYITMSFSIAYFERYFNGKSDYVYSELLLSVHKTGIDQIPSKAPAHSLLKRLVGWLFSGCHYIFYITRR